MIVLFMYGPWILYVLFLSLPYALHVLILTHLVSAGRVRNQTVYNEASTILHPECSWR